MAPGAVLAPAVEPSRMDPAAAMGLATPAPVDSAAGYVGVATAAATDPLQPQIQQQQQQGT